MITKGDRQFCVDKTGKYLCNERFSNDAGYYWPKYKTNIPILEIIDTATGKVIYPLDFHDSYLKDDYGVGSDISYNKKRNSFDISFTIEDETYFKGYYSIDKNKFFPTGGISYEPKGKTRTVVSEVEMGFPKVDLDFTSTD
jgi:hypothetical protein